MRKYICYYVLLMMFIFTQAHGVGNGPTADLRPALDGLMAVLGDKSLAGDEHLQERREKIMTAIRSGFNFREMSKRVLGKTWRSIDDSQRDHFTGLMTKLLENVYVGKLEGYSDQSVEFKNEVIKGNRAQVSTIIKSWSGDMPVHYIMKETANQWMVYDINIEGVSLVRNYQQQFKSILRKEKYKGLVKVLEEKNRSFLTTDK